MNAVLPTQAPPWIKRVAPDVPCVDRTMSVAFLLSHGFDALCLASSIAPMRAANDATGGKAFVWQYVAERSGAIRSSDGWTICATALDEQTTQADFVFLIGAPTAPREWARDPAGGSANLVRHGWRLGKLVGASNAAVFTLAQSGILKGKRFVVDRDLAATFAVRWPDLQPEDGIYAADKRILTCVGGTSAADMMLGLVQDRLGRDAQVEAMRACAVPVVRTGREPQLGSPAMRLGSRNPNLLRAVHWIDDHYLDADCLSGLAEQSGVSARQVQRLFRSFLGVTPKAYMTELRLRRAISLLSHTDLAINDIATECGYDATTSFTKAFRARYQIVPSLYRQSRALGLCGGDNRGNDRLARRAGAGSRQACQH